MTVFAEIRKRDGRVVPFDSKKIADAIFEAARAVGGEDRSIAEDLTFSVVRILANKETDDTMFTVEEVQDTVEKVLVENGHARTAKAYILYRAQRTRIRDAKSELMDAVEEILKETSRENANVSNSPSAKMLQIGSAASKKYYLSNLLPTEFSRAHIEGSIHIHDLDYYSKTLNCLQIDLTRLLKEGFNTGYGYIRPPKRIASAAAQAAIILQSNQNDMFGGQSFPHFDRSMGEVIRNMGGKVEYEEIFQAMEGFVYNLNTMHSRAGAQVPFSSLNFGTDITPEGRNITKAVLEAFYAGLGRGESPIFPNLVFRLKKGINLDPGDPNHDLFQLAVKVASRRLNPTFSFMDASINRKYGDEVSYMGCRSRVIANRHGPEISAGRGNIAPVTINLPRLSIEACGNIDRFMADLDRIMRLAAEQLLHRFELLSRLKLKDLPFLMGQHLYIGSEDLDPEDFIGSAIKNGSLAIGFIGLAETLVALTGQHHGEDSVSQELGLTIVERMRRNTDAFENEFDLNFVLYATPAEGLSGRFISMDRKDHGSIHGVTTRDYYTNSFHIPVDHAISLFDKISIEGAYHRFCNAGHITYVELDSSPEHNHAAMEKIIRHMADSDVGYGGVNYPVDECKNCAYSGLIPEECPSCGSPDIRRIRRITGYLSTEDRFNEAKLSELRDRKPHYKGGA